MDNEASAVLLTAAELKDGKIEGKGTRDLQIGGGSLSTPS